MIFTLAPEQPACLPGMVRFAGTVKGGGGRAAEMLWCDVPENCASAVPPRLDAWLLWLLPAAFDSGEPLVLEGRVDPLLLRNAHELMEVWASWRPGKRPVPIQAEAADPPVPGMRTGLCFTAGVDSFFSLLHHDWMVGSHPAWCARPIDDLLYVWGYDIPLEDKAAFQRKRSTLETIAVATGKAPIPMVSNFRKTAPGRLDWGSVLHGPALGAAGLLLGARWKHLLISASLCYRDQDPWGSSPLADPFFSTSATRVQHYGAGYDRFEKTEFIAGHQVALDHLHVCWQEATDRNCGKCEKCFRTLLTLDIVGARDRARSFPPSPFALEYLREVWKEHELVVRLYLQLRDHAEARGRRDVTAMIDSCLKPASGGKAGLSRWFGRRGP